MANSETLHFSVSEDAGKLLMQIAQEHLTLNYDPEKALRTITDCLMGCPVELALQILKGDVVLLVDVEEQNILPLERGSKGDNLDFPRIDIPNWCNRQADEILKNGEGLKTALDDMLFRMPYHKIHKTYDYSQILEFIAGNNEAILEDLRETEEVSQLELLVRVTKDFIEKSVKVQSVIHWLKKTYPDEFPSEKFFTRDSQYSDMLNTVMRKFNEMLHQDFTNVKLQSEELQSFVDSAIENDAILSKGIEPVDIMQNWSAGWLSPEGDYYALNGEIANMLHIQIGEALQTKGIIPLKDEGDWEINPDAWLEQHGWVKIHGNNINFAGCLNNRIEKKDVNMTQVQKDIIYNYGQRCHQCILRYGWKLIPASAAKINLLTDDQLNEMYFNF
ncbi:MAG: hypothetical protein WC333_00025 [Dehalococcoidia bacterium]|jgi:hypothetical protein